MHFDLKSLQDRVAIRDTIERYCRGIDRLDAHLIDSVYWPEAIDDHGLYKGLGSEFSAFVVPILREHCRSTMHMLGQSLIEIESDKARVETYFVAYHCGAKNGAEFIETSAGRYVDVFEERADEWRILDRTVVMEWTRLEENVKETPMPRSMFVQGRRDAEDLAYRKLSFEE